MDELLNIIYMIREKLKVFYSGTTNNGIRNEQTVNCSTLENLINSNNQLYFVFFYSFNVIPKSTILVKDKESTTVLARILDNRTSHNSMVANANGSLLNIQIANLFPRD